MKRAIVYAYPCRWDETPARQRYLMEAVSAYVPVVFLNSPRLSGKLFEARRPYAEVINSNLTIIHDAFGFRYSRFGKRLGSLATALDSSWLHLLFTQMGIQDYIYWLSAPDPKMLGGMRTNHLVYDCIDPCFDPEHQKRHDDAENNIARKSKIVFCTAESLLDRLKGINSSSYLLSNACSLEEYLPGENKLAPPAPLHGRKRPIVGYMGTFDGRVDMDVLIYAVAQLPDVTFALLGRINPDQAEKAHQLRLFPNVIMPGSVSVEEGRAYTAAFDVGLIPFKPGEMNDAINPVKMYMYLAAGKPVVTTSLKEPARFSPLVSVTRTDEEFVAAIRNAVAKSSNADVAERIAFAEKNRWEDRALFAVRCLQENGLLSPDARLQHEVSYGS